MVATNGSQIENLVEIKDLETYFEIGSKGIVMGIMANRKQVRAVDGVSLNIRHGETMGLVGESGCGKSTLGYNLVQLERPTAGSITFEGTDMSEVSRGELQRIRRRMQIIFQDPQSALDARVTIGDAVHTLAAGDGVVLPADVPHALTAREDTRIVLVRAR